MTTQASAARIGSVLVSIGWGLVNLMHGVPASAYTPAEEVVLAFEVRRCEAVLARDTAALDRMLADDLTYVHASGIRQSKKEYLDHVAAGKVTYTAFRIDKPTIHLDGDTAVTHGLFTYENANANPAARGASLYTAAYVRTGGAWKLTAWQATIKKQ